MKPTSIFLVSGAALLAGCSYHGEGSRPMHAVSELQCPDHEGVLTRVSVAADGQSCVYAGPRGAEVVLSLVKPANGAQTELASLDARMDELMPEVREKVEAAPTTPSPPENASGSSAPSKDNVDINMPGFHLHAGGDKAQIRMPGVSVDADGEKDGHDGNAHVRVGSVVDVRAHNDAAIVRVSEHSNGVVAVYRLADKTPSPAGWRMVGYDARGPAGGPLVIAEVHSREDQEKPLFHDADRLVKANVGG